MVTIVEDKYNAKELLTLHLFRLFMAELELAVNKTNKDRALAKKGPKIRMNLDNLGEYNAIKNRLLPKIAKEIENYIDGILA